jgi:hypothetical protein
LEALLGGWCLGREEFREDLLAQMNTSKGPEYFGPEIGESAAQKATRLVKEELERLGWNELELKRHRKGVPEKLKSPRARERKPR